MNKIYFILKKDMKFNSINLKLIKFDPEKLINLDKLCYI